MTYILVLFYTYRLMLLINTQKPDIFYTSKDRRCQIDTFYINLQNTRQILGFVKLKGLILSIIVLHPSRICTLYDQI
ncbi:hypothetical protein BpHYR1_053746 [Brachionus plicatilis]|uniref:Uncharacterized protein n=1 Tax=Brachionus plicatilis TaxID=10195 RepID=A0A3M7PQ88_BRAPC|nr:hypothetical protein BpHYR1_053746 [Brachionus plicatilis]